MPRRQADASKLCGKIIDSSRLLQAVYDVGTDVTVLPLQMVWYT